MVGVKVFPAMRIKKDIVSASSSLNFSAEREGGGKNLARAHRNIGGVAKGG
jgi:hypothetical protein